MAVADAGAHDPPVVPSGDESPATRQSSDHAHVGTQNRRVSDATKASPSLATAAPLRPEPPELTLIRVRARSKASRRRCVAPCSRAIDTVAACPAAPIRRSSTCTTSSRGLVDANAKVFSALRHLGFRE
jgi:hypothetical protein